MQPLLYLKSLLPRSFKQFAKDTVTRTAGIATTLPTLASRVHAMSEESEATNATLAELVHRTDYLKLKIEHIEVRLRNLSDDVEALVPLNKKISTLGVELANCRNLAEVAFQAVEALQLNRLGTGHKADSVPIGQRKLS
jgi:hypothetical protein